MSRPAWLDESLEEEWPEEEDAVNTSLANEQAQPSRPSPNAALLHPDSNQNPSQPDDEQPSPVVGTFLIREEIHHEPVTPAKLHGLHGKKTQPKSFFSPLALEKMFDPPSPPIYKVAPRKASRLAQSHFPDQTSIREHSEQHSDSQPASASGSMTINEDENKSHVTDEILASDIPNLAFFDGRKPSANYSFTFRPPERPQTDALSSIPLLPTADTRLRLFQTHDTFTRDQLSAIVDSIPVRAVPVSPSEPDDYSNQRSTKRIKLTAPDSLRGGTSPSKRAGNRSEASSWSATPYRPNPAAAVSPAPASAFPPPKNWKLESQQFMQHLKNARSVSEDYGLTESKSNPRDATSSLRLKKTPAVSRSPSPSASPSPSVQPRPPAKDWVTSSKAFMANLASAIEADTLDSGNDKENTAPYSHSSVKRGAKSRDTSLASSTSSTSTSSRHHAGSGVATTPERRGKRARSTSNTPIIRVQSPTRPLDDVIREAKALNQIQSDNLPSSSSSRQGNLAESGFEAWGSDSPPPRAVRDPAPAPTSIPLQQPSTSTGSTTSSSSSASTANPPPPLNGTVTLTIPPPAGNPRSHSSASSSTAFSAASGVKHAGTGNTPGVRTISPEDIGPITKVGNMIFDPERMMWSKERRGKNSEGSVSEVKGGNQSVGGVDGGGGTGRRGPNAEGKEKEVEEDVSIDIFAGIPSLKDEDEEQEDVVEEDGEDGDVVLVRRMEEEGEGNYTMSNEEEEEEEDQGYQRRSFASHSESESEAEDAERSSISNDKSTLSDSQSRASQEDMQRNFETTVEYDRPLATQDVNPQIDIDATPRPSRVSAPLAQSYTPRPIPYPSNSTPLPHPHPNRRRPPIAATFTPRSALKQTPSGSQSRQISGQYATPASSTRHRRSVSFSDGRKDGKILHLQPDEYDYGEEDEPESVDQGEVEESVDGEEEEEEEGDDEVLARRTEASLSLAPSSRAIRIENMLEALEDDTLGRWEPTPSKAKVESRRRSRTIPHAHSTSFARTHSESHSLSLVGHHTSGQATAGAISSSSTSSSSILNLSAASPHSTHKQKKMTTTTTTIASRGGPRHTTTVSVQANQTLLTEYSFAVTQDKLVQVITQVHPYEPYWENLPEIDLSGKGVESVARMKEFLPNLVTLDLHRNQISWLTGVPSNVRTLRASHNILTGMTAYTHLRNLESLDVSHNKIGSLNQLSCLPLLRELNADGNLITSVEGLEHMSSLVKLNLKGNRITQVNFRKCSWSRLESLDLNSNRLTSVSGLSTLTSLVLLDLDQNRLTSLTASGPIPRLRVLRMSDNRLAQFNAAPFPNLRTLYLDNNKLVSLQEMSRLIKLENLSLRHQGGGKLQLSPRDVRDLKRLYLSGNPLNDISFLTEPCYNLVYFELAGCRISTLPSNLAQMVPNVRVLNLNYNFISDVAPLQGLSRMKRLTLVGSRMKGTKTILNILRGMLDIEQIDLRMNPSTLSWYLPMLKIESAKNASEPDVRHPAIAPEADKDTSEEKDPNNTSLVRLPPSDSASSIDSSKARRDATWEELDSKFRRDLPDDAYAGRLAYRGMIMKACPKVRSIDGVGVTKGEMAKAEDLLSGVLKSRGGTGSGSSAPSKPKAIATSTPRLRSGSRSSK